MFSVSKLYKSVPFRILAISCGVILTCLCGFLQGKQLYDYDALGALAPNLYKIYIYVPTGLVLMLPMVYLGYLLNQKIQLNQAQFVKTVILIVGICLASISILLFAIELFRKGLSKVELKEMFNAHIFSELTILGLVLVICLIPLIFSSWVTTVILLGAFVASILVAGLLTLIRMSTAK